MGRIPKVDKERALEMVRRGVRPPDSRNKLNPALATPGASGGAAINPLSHPDPLAATSSTAMDRPTGTCGIGKAVLPGGAVPGPWTGPPGLINNRIPPVIMPPTGMGQPCPAYLPEPSLYGLGPRGHGAFAPIESAQTPGTSAAVPSTMSGVAASPNIPGTALCSSASSGPAAVPAMHHYVQSTAGVRMTGTKPLIAQAHIPAPLLPPCQLNPALSSKHTSVVSAENLPQTPGCYSNSQSTPHIFTPPKLVRSASNVEPPRGPPGERQSAADAGPAFNTEALDTSSGGTSSRSGFSRDVMKDLITQVLIIQGSFCVRAQPPRDDVTM